MPVWECNAELEKSERLDLDWYPGRPKTKGPAGLSMGLSPVPVFVPFESDLLVPFVFLVNCVNHGNVPIFEIIGIFNVPCACGWTH